MRYPIVITPLPDKEGGGYLAQAPDLMGCISDGDTPEEAVSNVQDAIAEWIDSYKGLGKLIPEPGSHAIKQKEIQKRHLEDLAELKQRQDDLDQKVEAVQSDVGELMAEFESHDSWVRFSDITGAVPPPSRRRQRETRNA